jgi:soluble lytic murein transglycosylase-like protein
MTQRPVRSPISRLPFTVLAAALFLAFAFSSSTMHSAVRLSRPAPDLQEIRSMHRLADWVAGTAGSKVFDVRALDSALAERSGPAALPGQRTQKTPAGDRGFELFRRAEDAVSPEKLLLAEIPFGQAIGDAARRNRLDGLLVAAVVEAESSFSPQAVSPRGAMGLMQVMPATADLDEAKSKELFDPHVNLDAGCRYLGSLIEHYDGDLELALAAYNAGPATVARYGGIPPYEETRHYVERVLARYSDHQQKLAR